MITKCDMHGSALGYSGSMGNAVRITNNHIYGNMTGISSDTLSAAGHPGFPADSSEIDHNYIYSNNLNLYSADPPVDPLVAVPIGTGIIYAGMNDARVHDNWIFDNWRDGAMLFAVPDAFTSGGGAEGDMFPGVSCPGAPATGSRPRAATTSSTTRSAGRRRLPLPGCGRHVRQRARPRRRQAAKPNGNDFWWGECSSNTGNCWFGNTGTDGTAASVTGPGEAGRLPGRTAAGAAVGLRHERRQRRPRQARLPDRVRERARRGHGADRLRLVDACRRSRAARPRRARA